MLASRAITIATLCLAAATMAPGCNGDWDRIMSSQDDSIAKEEKERRQAEKEKAKKQKERQKENERRAKKGLPPLPDEAGIYEKSIKNEKLNEEEQFSFTGAKMQNDRGLDAINKQKYDDAVLCFLQALKLVPDYVDAFNNLGRAYYLLGQYANAIQSLEMAKGRAERICPENKSILAFIHANKADIMRDQHKYEEAMAEYGEAIRLVPEMIRAHFEIGGIFLKQAKFNEALDCYDKVLEMDVNFHQARVSRAICLHAMGKDREALSEILDIEKRGYDVNPDFRNDVVKKLKERETR